MSKDLCSLTTTSTAAADAAINPRHPFAAHLARAEAAESAAPHRLWEPSDGPIPALYISHGAPFLFERTDWMTQLHDWARDIPRPRAIVIVSAHWEAAPLMMSSSRPSELVYDFGGFDPMYYTMRYDTPDASALARQVASVLPSEEGLHQHPSRGLDHGAWVPLKIMYPDAGIPVIQLSIPTHEASVLLGLGRELKKLREDGVLVVGSGYMTHGLPFLDWSNPDRVPGWSSDFDEWAARALAEGDLDDLAKFRTAAPGMPYAHPTVEHFTPLFVTLGAAADPTSAPRTAIDGFTMGLAKRSFQVA